MFHILRPDGDVALIDDVSRSDVCGMVAGGDRGKRAFVRSRNTMRTRQPRRKDVVHYRLSEIINEEEMNHLKLHE